MSRAWVGLLLVSCVTLSMLEDGRFRTADSAAAFDRAVKVVDEACFGVRTVQRESQLVYSKWHAWPQPDGLYLSRCMVLLSPIEGTDESDVRIAIATKQCAKAEFDDLDAQAEFCDVVGTIPTPIAEQLAQVEKSIEAAVRR